MPQTTLLWALLFGICVAGSFFAPLFGLAGYLLEYYQRPMLHWWGAWLPNLRWSLTIAVVLAASFLMHRDALPKVRNVRNVAMALLIAQGINMAFVNVWAVAPDLSLNWATRCWKIIVIYGLIVGVVRTPRALDAVLLLNIVGCGWWGYDGLGEQRVRSRLEGLGSSDTLNANLLAAHLLTVLPAIVILLWAGKDKRLRLASLVALPLVLNLFILANSRGATIGLAVSALSVLLLVRFKQRRNVVLGVAAAGLAVFMLADPQFIARQSTTAAADDGSAQTRLELWRGSLQLISDYPFGVGGRGFHILSPRYAPGTANEDTDMGRSAHNTYIQTAAEWGVQGLVLFLAFLGVTFWQLHRVRRESREPDWFYYRSLAIELGLIGTLAAGVFSVRFYGESVYWFSALAFALYRMPRESLGADLATQAGLPEAPRPLPTPSGSVSTESLPT